MSISFVIIGTRFVAITSFPSFKLSLAGLPIKIISFIFGPIIGFITGFTTDIISFIFMPAFYFPLYSVALGVSGMLPGLSAIFFNYFYKKLSKTNAIKRNNMKLIKSKIMRLLSKDLQPRYLNACSFYSCYKGIMDNETSRKVMKIVNYKKGLKSRLELLFDPDIIPSTLYDRLRFAVHIFWGTF